MTFYYLLRDRIPFYLTLIYIMRHEIIKKSRVITEGIGYYLISITWMLMSIVLKLLITGASLTQLVLFKWSFPSPLQWGFLTLIGTYVLIEKEVEVFDSYYISFMMSLAGGWVFEILYGLPFWIKSGFASWNVLNVNYNKVFFVDFQVLSVFIISYLIYSRFRYKVSKEVVYLSVVTLVWYLAGPYIAPFYHRMGNFGGNSMYAWVLRVPIGILIYRVLTELKTNE